jgi:hypothetical protein
MVIPGYGSKSRGFPGIKRVSHRAVQAQEPVRAGGVKLRRKICINYFLSLRII